MKRVVNKLEKSKIEVLCQIEGNEWKELQETRKIYLNNWLSSLECTLDGINYNIDNLSDKVDNLNK